MPKEQFGNFNFTPLPQEIGNVTVGEKQYMLMYKPEKGLLPVEVSEFLYKNWALVDDVDMMDVNKALEARRLDYLQQDEKIIALNSYSVESDTEFFDRYGNGEIQLTVVDPDSIRQGLGLFLTKRAVDAIIENAGQIGYTGKVRIRIHGETAAGKDLIKKLQAEYGDRIDFDVTETKDDDTE